MHFLSRFLVILYLIFSPIFSFENLKVKADEDISTGILINSKKQVLEDDLNDENYLIGAGDVFQLKFIQNKEFDTRFKVVKDGNAYLPIIEKVKLEKLVFP